MNWKTWAPAIAAVVMGGAAAKLARDSMSHTQGGSTPAAKVVRVVAAKEEIQPGQELTPDRLTLTAIASPTAPPNAFTDPKDLSGRISSAPLVPGQLVLQDFLAPRGAAPGLPALVPAGKRAVTIDVTETSSLGGMLAPGCYVDVVGTLTGSDNDKTITRTIVQNVLVQAVGQRLTPIHHDPDDKDHKPKDDGQNFRSVTLIASPKDAVTIQLAAMQGRISLLLRGTGDTQEADAAVSMSELRGGQPWDDAPVIDVAPPVTTPAVATPTPTPAAVETPKPSVATRWVMTIHGNKMSRVRFDAGNGSGGADGDDNGAGSSTPGAMADTPQDPIPDGGVNDEPRGKER